MATSFTNPDAGGRLKIFLGYAPGVGKSFAMLDESLRRKKRGQDVVIGKLDTQGRPAIQDLVNEFEIVPSKRVEFDGKTQEELDLDAISRRNPEIVIIDDLTHMNPPGLENEKRWQDVQDLLDSGISVLTTLNVQNLESLNDRVFEITGTRIRETVPDHIFAAANEVEMVDVTPRALIHRLERGDIYPKEEMTKEKIAWFTEGNLSALRELSLREIAGRVDADVLEASKAEKVARPWAVADRVMICVSPTRPSMRLIRRGWRIAKRLHAEVVAVMVEDHSLNERERRYVQDDFSLAERLGIKVERLHGAPSPELIRYARENNVTQLVIGHSERTRIQEVVQGSIISALTRELKTIDILVVASEEED